ncbi:hypothetical protein HON01_02020, partial [Candidatus Woesearchaeota archaeon]|nr:hypothetical protein [Candidatus Woesearchaeota archaeon]
AALDWFFPLRTIIGILPHGIFEIPALIFSSVMGVLLLTKLILRKRFLPKKSFFDLVKFNLKAFIEIVIVLLLIAAVVEVFITGNLINPSGSYLSDEDLSLDSYLMSETDLIQLGISDPVILDLSDFLQRGDSFLNNPRIKFVSTISLVYDDELFSQAKQYANISSFMKLVEFDYNSTKFVLSQQVVSFDSKLDANNFVNYLDLVDSKINISGLSYEQQPNSDLTKVNYRSFSIFETTFTKPVDNKFLVYSIALEPTNKELIELLLENY